VGLSHSQMSVMAWYIHQLTNECTELSSSVHAIFLTAGTKEYILVIFLGTEEYKVTEECTIFSYSEERLYLVAVSKINTIVIR
jgi:hypothetical protein